MVMMTSANHANALPPGGGPMASPEFSASAAAATNGLSHAGTSWPNFVSPNSSGASTASSHYSTGNTTTTNNTVNHSKRGRGGHEQQQQQPPPYAGGGDLGAATWHDTSHNHHHHQQQQQPPPQQPLLIQQQESSKRRRNASYVPPREIPKTLISSVGSLAAAAAAPRGAPGSNLRMGLRQQLSGSNLMEFLGRDDDMEVEDQAHETRPRSMSF